MKPTVSEIIIFLLSDIFIDPIFVSNVANTISLTNISEDVRLLKIVDLPLLV